MSNVKVTKVARPEDRAMPVFGEIEKLMAAIRHRAYELFAGRGYAEGHELDDWLEAEREFCWPAAEFVEDDEKFTLEVALAGFEPAEVSVTAAPRELIVKALHEQAPGEEPKAAPAKRTRWSAFLSDEVYRRIELPADVSVDGIVATMRNGLLRIVAPKAARPAAKIVKVKEAA